jgi:hypothetical protein
MVLALTSWLIAVGVVLILGAVFGIAWQERGLSFTDGAQGNSARGGNSQPGLKQTLFDRRYIPQPARCDPSPRKEGFAVVQPIRVPHHPQLGRDTPPQ